MDFTVIASAIDTVGFPVLAFIICAWFLKYTYDKSADTTKEITGQISNLAEAVNNNTKVLTELVTKIDDRLEEEK